MDPPVNDNRTHTTKSHWKSLESPEKVKTGEETDGAIQLGKSLITLEWNCKYIKHQMAPGQHAPYAHRNLTGNYTSTLAYHPITVRQNWELSAPFCLGESPEYK